MYSLKQQRKTDFLPSIKTTKPTIAVSDFHDRGMKDLQGVL